MSSWKMNCIRFVQKIHVVAQFETFLSQDIDIQTNINRVFGLKPTGRSFLKKRNTP